MSKYDFVAHSRAYACTCAAATRASVDGPLIYTYFTPDRAYAVVTCAYCFRVLRGLDSGSSDGTGWDRVSALEQALRDVRSCLSAQDVDAVAVVDRALAPVPREPHIAGSTHHIWCRFAGPHRSNCEHAVGVPAKLDYPTTTDAYGIPHGWCEYCWSSYRLQQALSDLERVRVQLAGCSTAALGFQCDVKLGDYGYSASLGDVMELRRKYLERVKESVMLGNRLDLLQAKVVQFVRDGVAPCDPHFSLVAREDVDALSKSLEASRAA